MIGPLATAQWVGLFIIVAAVVFLVITHRCAARPKPTTPTAEP